MFSLIENVDAESAFGLFAQLLRGVFAPSVFVGDGYYYGIGFFERTFYKVVELESYVVGNEYHLINRKQFFESRPQFIAVGLGVDARRLERQRAFAL